MILQRIDELIPGAILDRHDFRGDLTAVISPEHYVRVVRLAFEEGFQLLVDLTAVDWLEREPRFDVVVHLLNLVSQDRLRLKVPVALGQALPSLTPLHRGADWFEREVFDLFGIPFEGHPNLKRLMMWEDYPGHPLRKDHPLDGGDAFCTSDTGTSYAGGARSLAE